MITPMSRRVNRSDWGALLIDRPNNMYYWARFLIHPYGTANGVPLDPDSDAEVEVSGAPDLNEYHFHLVLTNTNGQRLAIQNAVEQETVLVCKRDAALLGEFKEYPVQWLDGSGFRGFIIADEEELPE
jgi:hypothetical protein